MSRGGRVTTNTDVAFPNPFAPNGSTYPIVGRDPGREADQQQRTSMTTIESKQVEIGKGAQELYAFLQDMNNFQQLLPQDRISEWKSDGRSCSFKVQGAATIGLELAGGEAPHLVILKATDRSPFPFTLNVHLKENNGVTTAWQQFEGDINPFIKMMVEKPLKALFDHIADKMKAIHG